MLMACDSSAEMIFDELGANISVVNDSIPIVCAITSAQTYDWNVDISDVRCRCRPGFKQGLGSKSSECVACRDGTFAPLNVWQSRSECRACPREGVDCNGGKLTILKDFWYDVGSTLVIDEEGKSGLRPTTAMYKCMQREACLLDLREVPMRVKCHENHTGVLCARCYHRKNDCGRTAANGDPGSQTCESPGWLQGHGSDKEWMYFAPLARHCTRCPSGRDAYFSYALTAAIALLVGVLVFGVVAHRLFNVWKRLQGKKRSKASGVARVFFNWMQMMSMLQSIKLQPPEEVSDAMETAEVVNISLEWFPIQCTLRLTFFNRVCIYMLLPLLAVFVPFVLVACCSNVVPCLRRGVAHRKRQQEQAKHTRSRCSTLNKMLIIAFTTILGEDDSADRNARHLAKDSRTELEGLQDDFDALYHDVVALEAQLAANGSDTDARAGGAAASGDAPGSTVEISWWHRECIEVGMPVEHESRGAGSVVLISPMNDRRVHVEFANGEVHRYAHVSWRKLMSTGSRYFKVQGKLPIALRTDPRHDAAKMGRVAKPHDVVRAAEVRHVDGLSTKHERITWILLRGEWGEGWIFDGLPNRKAQVPPFFVEVAPSSVVDVNDESISRDRDEITHVFNAVAAMSGVKPETSAKTITRDAIEHTLPAKWNAVKMNAFFGDYDANGDGALDFPEFVDMYPALRQVWRFEQAWAQFRLVDTDGSGMLELDEMHRVVPKGASPKEIEEWLARFDRHGHGYITLSDYAAVERAVQRDFIWLAVGTSFVLCTYFVYSRVTKSLLSIFALEQIEGGFYLKLELGTPALTAEHTTMMLAAGVMLVCFSALVPVLGLFAMFQVRYDIHSRKVATIAGFLTDGYREDVAWVWEFIVLARKLIILGISLFVWDSFLQSFAAIVVLLCSIAVQLQVKPFELPALNLLEAAALSSLLITQMSGILLWYKQQPDKNDYLQPLQYGLTGMLFACNGAVIAGFVTVTAWAWLKEKSTSIIQWVPDLYSAFTAITVVEDNVHWLISGMFCPKKYNNRVAKQRKEEWHFIIADREGRLFGRGFRAKQVKAMSARTQKIKALFHRCRRRCGCKDVAGNAAVVRQERWQFEMDMVESSSDFDVDVEPVVDVNAIVEAYSTSWWETESIAVGDRVRHATRGPGAVICIDVDGDGRVYVQFSNTSMHRYTAQSWHKFTRFAAASDEPAFRTRRRRRQPRGPSLQTNAPAAEERSPITSNPLAARARHRRAQRQPRSDHAETSTMAPARVRDVAEEEVFTRNPLSARGDDGEQRIAVVNPVYASAGDVGRLRMAKRREVPVQIVLAPEMLDGVPGGSAKADVVSSTTNPLLSPQSRSGSDTKAKRERSADEVRARVAVAVDGDAARLAPTTNPILQYVRAKETMGVDGGDARLAPTINPMRQPDRMKRRTKPTREHVRANAPVSVDGNPAPHTRTKAPSTVENPTRNVPGGNRAEARLQRKESRRALRRKASAAALTDALPATTNPMHAVGDAERAKQRMTRRARRGSAQPARTVDTTAVIKPRRRETRATGRGKARQWKITVTRPRGSEADDSDDSEVY